ncbi:hypothetical protein AC622_04165 [Bacillus sp. FJAT-27916]|nr:hypothetical protein AC622_04165 [Bacillus sp. FJAT-27916]
MVLSFLSSVIKLEFLWKFLVFRTGVLITKLVALPRLFKKSLPIQLYRKIDCSFPFYSKATIFTKTANKKGLLRLFLYGTAFIACLI